MRFTRIRLAASAIAVATLAIAAPVGSATAQVPVGGVPFPGGCPFTVSPSGIGDAGTVQNQICGAALVFTGPSIGQVASVVGPTIIGSVVNAPVTASAGPVGVVPY
jgi:hypothetical protein